MHGDGSAWDAPSMGGEAHAFLRHASQKSHLLHAMLFRAVAAFCPWTVCTARMTTEISPSRKTPRRRAARGSLPRHPLESPSPRPGTLRAASRTLTGRQEPQATWRLQMPDASEANEIAAEHGTTLHPTASGRSRGAEPTNARGHHVTAIRRCVAMVVGEGALACRNAGAYTRPAV